MGRKAQLVNIQNGVTNPQSPEVSLYFNETALSAPGTTIDTNIGWKERGKDRDRDIQRKRKLCKLRQTMILKRK